MSIGTNHRLQAVLQVLLSADTEQDLAEAQEIARRIMGMDDDALTEAMGAVSSDDIRVPGLEQAPTRKQTVDVSESIDPEALEAAHSLAVIYAGAFNTLEIAGEDVEDLAQDADEELDGTGWNLARSRSTGRWVAVRDAAEDDEPDATPIDEAGGERAPKGGIDLNGKHYPGGRFIPAKVVADLDPAQRQKLEQAKANAAQASQAKADARRQRGSVDTHTLRNRLAMHADRHGLTDFDRRRAGAAARLLHRHHGELALHRVEELADRLEAALGRIGDDEWNAEGLRANLGQQLARLHAVRQGLQDAGVSGEVAKQEGPGSAERVISAPGTLADGVRIRQSSERYRHPSIPGASVVVHSGVDAAGKMERLVLEIDLPNGSKKYLARSGSSGDFESEIQKYKAAGESQKRPATQPLVSREQVVADFDASLAADDPEFKAKLDAAEKWNKTLRSRSESAFNRSRSAPTRASTTTGNALTGRAAGVRDQVEAGIDAYRKDAVSRAVENKKEVPDAILAHVGFTGTDSMGREWVDGKLVAKQEEAAPATAGGAGGETAATPTGQDRDAGMTGTDSAQPSVKKGSTGEVILGDREVSKNSTRKEADVYRDLAGVDGISPGREEGGKIITPRYKNVISVDDIPFKSRKSYGPILKPNLARMVNAVTALSDAGYAYNDPLQFGFDDKRRANLFDFSMASKSSGAAKENLIALGNYLKQFGLERHGQAMSKVAEVMDWMDNPESRDLAPDDPEVQAADAILRRLDDRKPRYAYYSFNAREIPGVAQSEPIDGAKVVFSDTPLDAQTMSQWELHPAIHRTRPEDEPGFTGTDSLGREWVDGALVAAQDAPAAADAGGGGGGPLAHQQLGKIMPDMRTEFEKSRAAEISNHVADDRRRQQEKYARSKKRRESAAARLQAEQDADVKQNHEMTLDDYRKEYQGNYGDMTDAAHRQAVESALASGKPVPPEVLADYPDLAAKYAPSTTTTAANAGVDSGTNSLDSGSGSGNNPPSGPSGPSGGERPMDGNEKKKPWQMRANQYREIGNAPTHAFQMQGKDAFGFRKELAAAGFKFVPDLRVWMGDEESVDAFKQKYPRAKVNGVRTDISKTPRLMIDLAEHGHEQAVKRALQRGESVPAEVLADYPDLAEKYAK